MPMIPVNIGHCQCSHEDDYGTYHEDGNQRRMVYLAVNRMSVAFTFIFSFCS